MSKSQPILTLKKQDEYKYQIEISRECETGLVRTFSDVYLSEGKICVIPPFSPERHGVLLSDETGTAYGKLMNEFEKITRQSSFSNSENRRIKGKDSNL